MRLAGYAALFGRRDGARDAIRPGAFARTLADRRADGLGPLPLIWQHRPDQRMGWVEHVAEDARGLRVVATIDNPDGVAAQALQRGAVTGLSFGYRATEAEYSPAGRDLIAIDLFEISVVSFPLQHGARVHFVVPGQARDDACFPTPAFSRRQVPKPPPPIPHER